jgi:hypothetical protein
LDYLYHTKKGRVEMQNPKLLIALVDILYQQKEINRETYERVLKQIMRRTSKNGKSE